MSRLRLFAKRLFLPAPDPLAQARKWVRRLFLHGEGARTLDIGCGNGYYTLAAARMGGGAVGLSFDRDALERAAQMRDYLGLSADQVRFELVDLREWTPQVSDDFDQVLLFEVLEHLLDDSSLLVKAHQVLKPGGSLFVSAPNRACGLRDTRPHVSREESGWHVRHGYTFEQLEALLTNCGFEPVDRRGLGWLGAQVVARLAGWIPMSQSTSLLLHTLTYPLWRPLALLLDLLPFGQPHSILVIARKARDASAG